MAFTPPSLESIQLLGFIDFAAFFAKELCDLLFNLEASRRPGSGKKIACLLSDKDTR
jgi:hypothetical protein